MRGAGSSPEASHGRSAGFSERGRCKTFSERPGSLKKDASARALSWANCVDVSITGSCRRERRRIATALSRIRTACARICRERATYCRIRSRICSNLAPDGWILSRTGTGCSPVLTEGTYCFASCIRITKPRRDRTRATQSSTTVWLTRTTPRTKSVARGTASTGLWTGHPHPRTTPVMSRTSLFEWHAGSRARPTVTYGASCLASFPRTSPPSERPPAAESAPWNPCPAGRTCRTEPAASLKAAARRTTRIHLAQGLPDPADGVRARCSPEQCAPRCRRRAASAASAPDGCERQRRAVRAS